MSTYLSQVNILFLPGLEKKVGTQQKCERMWWAKVFMEQKLAHYHARKTALTKPCQAPGGLDCPYGELLVNESAENFL